MWQIDVPDIGTFTFDGADGYYSAELAVGRDEGVEIEIEGEPDASLKPMVERFVASLDEQDRGARDLMAGRLGPVPEAVSFYLRHHLEAATPETLTALGVASVDEATVEGLVERLHVCIVQIIATPECPGAQIDYSLLGEEVSNNLLVIRMDSRGRITDVDMES